MASWENAALRLSTHVHVESTSTLLHKSLPPVPNQKSPSTTKFQDESSEEDSKSPKGWKPLSLSTPILLAVMALTILLAAAVETIAQRSATQGGLALSPTLDDLPGYAKFGYLYVPTIIAVFYSMIWSWIDLDVKRMQPWFELSKTSGATGENSIFLDYQYDFVALVPFKAAKRKHWPVFFGGTAMVIVFWAITPLQSALLGTGIVKQTDSTAIGIRSELVPVSEHKTLLDPEFLNTGYAVGWLGQSFPPFTTSKYALLPYYTANNSAPPKVESNVTAVTTKLSTELNCWPAEVHQDGPKAKGSFFFLNGQGCNTTVFFGVLSRRRMFYIGYYSDAYSDFYLSNSECPKTANSTHQFLAIWAKTVEVPGQESPDFNMTALFCQPQYYKQQVFARVNSSDLKPDSDFEHSLSPKEVLSEREFNATAFEYLLANGMAENPIVKDWPFNSVVEQHPRLNYTGFTQPVSNMVGFALAGKNMSSDTYADPKVLQKVYNDAHQYLFTLAVNKLLTNVTDMSNRTASTEYFLYGVIVSRAFATAVESFMGVVAVFTFVVLWFCQKTPSHLPANPSSINRHIDIFRESTTVMHSFRSMDNATEKTLFEAYKDDNFQLLDNRKQDTTTVHMNKAKKEENESEENKPETQKGYYDPARPFVLRRISGVLFVAVLIGAMVFLSYLKQEETRLNGLYRPSESFEVLQLLENYIPTIFATLIEPLWILLNRHLCSLQPFKDLWEGQAKPSRSLDATYTAVPPQLAIWRAAMSRHFLLVLVCAMALLANLLAVGLGSLFNEEPMIASYAEMLQPAFAPRFDNHSVTTFDEYLSQNLITSSQYKDHMYVAMANVSSGTRLPAWVTPDYFFQPYKLGESGTRDSADTYTLETQGFGVAANCTTVTPFKLPIYKEEVQLVKSTDGKLCTQTSLVAKAGSEMRASTSNRSTGASSIEYASARTADFAGDPCDTPLTLGWGRTAAAENVNDTVEAGFMICYPVFETAKFNVTVDTSGYVLSYNKTGNLANELDYADSQAHTEIVFEVYNRWWNMLPEWHNDTTARDWLNYFITVLHENRTNLDPATPVPEPESLTPVVEEMYRRLYAIILGLNEQIFDHENVGKSITATRRTKETRIFMEDASFIITMTVLALNTVVASIFYIRAIKFVLPRMPTTIGSILAYVAPSRLASSSPRRMPGQAGRTFSFGRYLDADGEVRLGIELDPYVVRIEPSSLRAKKDPFAPIWAKFRGRGENPARKNVKSGPWL